MGDVSRWCERAFDAARQERLTAAGLSPLVARLLAARGIDADSLEEFFNPAMTRLADPSSLPGIDEAVRVMMPLVRERRKIVVFGDYDVDGVSASAILVSTIRRLQASDGSGMAPKVDAFIPKRFGEGYGMTAASLARLRTEHPDVALVVTVDNGISSPDEVASLRADGIKVVVTDHHLPGERLPEAEALVNPRVCSACGCDGLCGAGVAFFLAMALTRAAVQQGMYRGAKFGGPLLVLAGLATVADLMPLQGQNRVLVTQSLANFNYFAPLGLKELYQRAARVAASTVEVRDYGFALAPRINAAGRMETARKAYELLMCSGEDEREQARRLAFEIDSFNAQRKTVEQRMDSEAREQLAGEEHPDAIVVSDGECPAGESGGWHLGVAGIVASRLLETYHVPAAVVVGDTGSVRAPEGYNVHDVLTEASAHLVRFGGHAAAGGFTIKPGEFLAFRQDFNRACAKQRAAAPDAAAEVFDAWVEPQNLTLELYDELRRMEPFGEGNPEPVFGLRNVAFSDIRLIGAGRHATFSFVNRSIPRAVWWGHGPEVDFLRSKMSTRYDVLFTMTTSEYGGEPRHVELRMVALRACNSDLLTSGGVSR